MNYETEVIDIWVMKRCYRVSHDAKSGRCSVNTKHRVTASMGFSKQEYVETFNLPEMKL